MEKIYDMIIIGAGPAGLTSGIYGGRAKLDVLIIEKGVDGGQITITDEVVNYPGILKTTGKEFGKTAAEQAKNFGCDFVKDEVIGIDFTQDIKVVNTKNGTYKALSCVLATGATPRKLGFPGEIEFGGRGVAYCATCDGEFFTGLPVFVVGAGYAAAEEAMFLTKYASSVTIIAREPEFTCAKSIADKVLNHPKITVKFNSELLSAGGDKKLHWAKFKNNKTGETWEYKTDDTFGIFVFIGYAPQTNIFRGVVDLDKDGYIITDNDLKTNIDGIYAAGDVRPKRLKQLVTAVSDGAIAATDIEKYVAGKRERLGLVREKISENKTTEQKKKILGDDVAMQIKEVAKRFEKKVIVEVIRDLSKKDYEQEVRSKAMLDIVEEIAELSDKIEVRTVEVTEDKKLQEKVRCDYVPTIALFDEYEDFKRVKYTAAPGGHELTSFFLALYNIAGPGQPLDDETRELIMSIDRPVDLKIGISLTCTKCPTTVQSAQRIAILNPNVNVEIIDIFNFKDFKDKYDIMSVPAIVLNDKDVFFGAKDIPTLIADIFKRL